MPELYPPYHYFTCPECDKDKKMTTDEFIDHIKNVHEIKEAKGKRGLLLHINKKPRHASTFQWTIEEKIFYEYYG